VFRITLFFSLGLACSPVRSSSSNILSLKPIYTSGLESASVEMEYLSLNTISIRFWSCISTSGYPGSMDLLESIKVFDHPSSSNFAESSLEYLRLARLVVMRWIILVLGFLCLLPVDFDEQERTFKQ